MINTRSVPQPGDVLFINSPELVTYASWFVQSWLDADANDATRSFGHVAIMITDLLALEAMPTDPKDMIGQWTGSKLREGVRLIPIADLIIPIMPSAEQLIVLRAPAVDEATLSNFTAPHPSVLQMLQSKYSIDMLRKEVEARAPKIVMNLFTSKFDWTSNPNDMTTRLNLDQELRSKIKNMLPDLSLPDVARTYFCSQAVIKCLKIAGLVPNDFANDLTTPTGLYKLLDDRKWDDVTAHYKCAPDVQQYLDMIPEAHAASYTEFLAMTVSATQEQAGKLGIEIIEKGLEAMSRKSNEIIKKLT